MKFGLQEPEERRHFHLSDAESRDFLLQTLDESGQHPVLTHNLPGFPYKGFRLVQVSVKFAEEGFCHILPVIFLMLRA